MDKFKKSQTESKRNCYFLRSVKVEEIEDMSFPSTKKIKIENNSESPMNFISSRETKPAENSTLMFEEMKKNISSDNTSDKSNKKVSKLQQGLKLAKIKTENEELLDLVKIKTENEGRLNLVKIKTENEERLNLVKIKTENEKEHLDLPEFKADEKEVTISSKANISRADNTSTISNFGRRKRKQNSQLEMNHMLSNFKKEKNSKLPKIKIENRKPNSSEATEDVTFHNVEGITENADKILLEERGSEKENDTEYEAFSNYFDVKIPLVGKKFPINNNDKPFTKRYDLAIERNRRRRLHDKETGIEDKVLKLIEEKKVALTDKKKYDMEQKTKDVNVACYLTQLCYKILEALKSNVINEKKVIIRLGKFLLTNVTPTCLLYVPHLVHTILYIRGNKQFPRVIRLVANECYDKCHAMFPIPDGYNFETMYTSEMRKFLPDGFDKMENTPLDYGDIDDLLESSYPAEDSNTANGDVNNFDNLGAE